MIYIYKPQAAGLKVDVMHADVRKGSRKSWSDSQRRYSGSVANRAAALISRALTPLITLMLLDSRLHRIVERVALVGQAYTLWDHEVTPLREIEYFTQTWDLPGFS